MKNDLKILLYNKISMILLKEWDPIGIQNTPEAHDEYEAYAASLLELIVSGKLEHEILNICGASRQNIWDYKGINELLNVSQKSFLV